jgi:hypothetical protein
MAKELTKRQETLAIMAAMIFGVTPGDISNKPKNVAVQAANELLQEVEKISA